MWKLDRYMREDYHEGYKMYKEHFIKLKNSFTYLASLSSWPFMTQEASIKYVKDLQLIDGVGLDEAKVKWLFFQTNVEIVNQEDNPDT